MIINSQVKKLALKPNSFIYKCCTAPETSIEEELKLKHKVNLEKKKEEEAEEE